MTQIRYLVPLPTSQSSGDTQPTLGCLKQHQPRTDNLKILRRETTVRKHTQEMDSAASEGFLQLSSAVAETRRADYSRCLMNKAGW